MTEAPSPRTPRRPRTIGSVAVVGASLSGLSAARALREAGFTGRIVVIGDEVHPPYDRPPLSKEFLAGTRQVEEISLSMPQDEALALEWRLGVRATGLAPAERGYRIPIADADPETVDAVVLATGARARLLPGCELAGVHTLRTLDDAVALRDELVPDARLVVVGGGFIGAEIASTALQLGVRVTLVEAASTALAGPLGEELGALFAALHEARGVEVITGVGVAAILPSATDSGRVHGVRLADGRELAADVVVVGIGSLPNTEWLAGSGVDGAGPDGDLAGGVLIDEDGATNLPGVVATGDVAAHFDHFAQQVVRTEHWTAAQQHPATAVATLLGTDRPQRPPASRVPYFWSDQYGLTFQFAGHRRPGDTTEVVEGDPADHRFVAVYRREGVPVAVLGIGMPKVFTRWRKELAATHLPADPPPPT